MFSSKASSAGMAAVSTLLFLAGCSGGDGGSVLTGGGPPQGGVPVTPQITRVSVSSDSVQGNGASLWSMVSADARFVSFTSEASNLVTDDTNGVDDAFVRDQEMVQTTRISLATDGTQSNDHTGPSALSSDGRFVVFDSDASNLVPNDTNGVTDVFLRDRQNGTTTRVSVDSTAAQSNGASLDPHISASGRFIVFESDASNLVANDTNGLRDIFLHDVQSGTTTRINTDSAGNQALGGFSEASFISAGGGFVVFSSEATNLVPNDTNGVRDVFVKNLNSGATTRVSVDSTGQQGDQNSGGFFRSASISADGTVVAFHSDATNLVPNDTNGVLDVFVHNTLTGTTTRVSVDSAGAQGDNSSLFPVLSGDGRFIGFQSRATNLVANDTNGVTDVFLHDRNTGTSVRLSVSATGEQGNGISSMAYVSQDGSAVSFESVASNLVPNDTNGVRDIFLAPNPLD